MQKVIMMGRLVNDPETRFTQNNKQHTKFKLAVSRRGKPQEGQPNADFFYINTWGKTAEFCSKHFKKGQQVLIEGHIRNNSWTDQQGNKKYSDDIYADEVYFADSKKDRTENSEEHKNSPTPQYNPPFGGEDDDDLPF